MELQSLKTSSLYISFGFLRCLHVAFIMTVYGILTRLTTVNGKSFVELNFCGIHNLWIFAVMLMRYKARMLISYICLCLEQNIHWKNFHASLKTTKA